MKTTNIYVIKLKKNFLPMLFLFFTFCLLIFSKNNLVAVKNGLSLWANSVVPSLFPFFVATELLSHTNIINQLGNILNFIMKPLFNVNGKGSFAFIMGIISGYPIGAKIAANFRKKNICSKEECERLLSFTNNSGPLFIIGTVGISMFGNTIIGILLFVTHLLASITVGFIFRFWKYKDSNISSSNSLWQSSTNNSYNIGEILSSSIKNSIVTILNIGGFIVLFSVIISIFNKSHLINLVSILLSPIFNIFNIPPDFSNGIINGFLEITNGLQQISAIPIRNISFSIVICAFILGFGGISVILQVYSFTSKTDISIKPYILGKFLQGIISAFLTFLLFHFLPFLSLDLSNIVNVFEYL